MRRFLWVLVVFGAVLTQSGCDAVQKSEDFDRHRLSKFTVPEGKDVFYFDTTTGQGYPDDDANAEAIRMNWLNGWLRQRKMCPDNYEILERRPFDFLEYNPERHNLRYVVKCKTPAPPA